MDSICASLGIAQLVCISDRQSNKSNGFRRVVFHTTVFTFLSCLLDHRKQVYFDKGCRQAGTIQQLGIQHKNSTKKILCYPKYNLKEFDV